MANPPHWIICPTCFRSRPKAVIVDGRCDLDRIEAERAVAAQDYRVRLEDDGWTGPQGDAARADRNILLNLWEWTTRPGSPLSSECQSKFIAFFTALHRLTVDFEKPSDVVWPDPPALIYGE